MPAKSRKGLRPPDPKRKAPAPGESARAEEGRAKVQRGEDSASSASSATTRNDRWAHVGLYYPDPATPREPRAKHHDVAAIGVCPFCHRASRWLILSARLHGVCLIHGVLWRSKCRAEHWPVPTAKQAAADRRLLEQLTECDAHFDLSEALEDV